MRRRVLLLCCVLSLPNPAATADAGDWSQFRGEGGQGHAEVQTAPLRWDGESNVAWRVAVPGRGWSSPVVADGRLYLTTAVAEGDDPRAYDAPQVLRVLCLDAESGRTLWNVEVFRHDSTPIHPKNSHASPTPIVDGRRVFVHFGTQGTASLTTDGEVVWRNRSIGYTPVHGGGGSPALVGRSLIFSADGASQPFVVALDRDTGEQLWRTPRPPADGNQFAFSTPLPIDVAGRTQVVVPGANHVCSYDPDSGEELWRVRYPGGFSVIPRPVFAHGLVFVSSGFMNPVLFAIRPDGRGDVTESHVSWTEQRGIPRNASPLAVGDEVYVVADNGIASCFDARTGRRHWQRRLSGDFSASPLYAAGRLYFLNELGETTILEPGPSYTELARNDLGERTQASAAAVEGALFIRTESGLYRLGGATSR